MSLCFLSGKVARVLKMLAFFPNSLGSVGWLLLVYWVLEGLVVFVFLVLGFLFGVGFVSVCLLCFVLWLDVVVSVSVLCFFLLCFCFFGGFKGQVRWPTGPPHLALNPPYLLVLFLLLLFLFVCCCFFGLLLFVLFFGGFKGHVRWPKGPPHLAPNPPFVFFCFFLFCFFVLLSFLCLK